MAHFLPARKAFTPCWDYPEAKVVWALRAALLALGVYALVVRDLAFTTRPMLVTTVLVGAGVSLLMAFVQTDRPRTLSAAEGVMLLAITLHVSGHAFGLYDRFRWYDLGLHFAVPLVTALVLFALSQATDWIWNWRKVTPLEVGIYLFSMSMAVGATWEIVEFGMDRFAGTREQDNLADTMIDLIADWLGALLGAIVAGRVTATGRRRGWHVVSEEPTQEPRGDATAAAGARDESPSTTRREPT